jgi:hypothetical protein
VQLLRRDTCHRDAASLAGATGHAVEDSPPTARAVPLPICTASTSWAAMLQKALDKLLRGWQIFFERRLNLLGRKDEPTTLNRVGP